MSLARRIRGIGDPERRLTTSDLYVAGDLYESRSGDVERTIEFMNASQIEPSRKRTQRAPGGLEINAPTSRVDAPTDQLQAALHDGHPTSVGDVKRHIDGRAICFQKRIKERVDADGATGVVKAIRSTGSHDIRASGWVVLCVGAIQKNPVVHV